MFLIALSLNLLIGNLLLSKILSNKNYADIAFSIHLFASITAFFILYLLFKIIKKSDSKIILLLIPIAFAALVPLSTYIFYSFMLSLDDSGFKGFMGLLLFAFFPVFFTSPLWLSMGLINSVFCFFYKRDLKQSR